MKTLRIGLLVVSIVLVFAVAAAAESPLSFKDFKGRDVLFGPVYTYSITVEGSYNQIGWSATGGKVVREWMDGNRYFCEVQWLENNPDDPAKLKVWGEDKASGEEKAERFPITQDTSKKRAIDYRQLQSVGGKCLEIVLEDLVRDGGHVQIMECKNEPQQKWKFDAKGRLVNQGGKCLDVNLPELKNNGGRVQAWECAEVEQQKWKLDEQGRLVNGGGKCLDVNAPDMSTDGGKVQIWDCAGVDNQKWKIIE